MKKLLYICSALFISAITITGCDIVENDFVEENTSTISGRTVLIEDYTGHECVNCPTAGVIIDGIKDDYDDKVIVVAIHSGYFAQPNTAFPEDFNTSVGDELDAFFNVEIAGKPNGLVNRTIVNGSYIITPNNWEIEVPKLLATSKQVELEITNSYDSTSRSLSTTVDMELLATLRGEYKLSVYIIESHIIGPQKNNNTAVGATPVISDYEHNHVLRGSFNGTWGDVVIEDIGIISQEITKDFTLQLDSTWVAENCDVVAFIYDATTLEVIQAAEMHVTQ